MICLQVTVLKGNVLMEGLWKMIVFAWNDYKAPGCRFDVYVSQLAQSLQVLDELNVFVYGEPEELANIELNFF